MTRAGHGGRGHAGAGAALAALIALTAACGSNDGPSPSALGFRSGTGLFDGEQFAEIEQWLETDVAYTVQFSGRQSAKDMNGSVFGLLADETSSLPAYSKRLQLSLTVPLAFGKAKPTTGEGRDEVRANLLATAGGENDDSYRRIAARLVEAGYGDAVVRLGHEFNGAWAPWSSRANEDAFIAAWRHVHDVLREEAPNLLFDWTAVRPAWFEWGPDAYPGDDYVDIVGLDIYWRVEPRDEPWDSILWERQYGRVLRDHFAFAVEHGKPVSYPEWGLAGDDVPQFIRTMHEWLSSLPERGPGSLVYHSYFDGKGQFDLDLYPKSREEFRRLFGDQA